MPGIRIQHPTARNARYTVVDSDRPYPIPYHCTSPLQGGCGSIHLFKTHHLNLDVAGSVIVSTGVFDLLAHRLQLDGFVVTNEVASPPPLGVDLTQVPGGGISIVKSPNLIEPI